MRPEPNAQRTVDGFKLPADGAMTENERTWVEFLRIISNDAVPALDSEMVVGLRKLMGVV
ncbi:MAG: hypothetical protein ACK47C_10245 [Paracoccaceae bacterium]|jgi:hypothetical protein